MQDEQQRVFDWDKQARNEDELLKKVRSLRLGKYETCLLTAIVRFGFAHRHNSDLVVKCSDGSWELCGSARELAQLAGETPDEVSLKSMRRAILSISKMKYLEVRDTELGGAHWYGLRLGELLQAEPPRRGIVVDERERGVYPPPAHSPPTLHSPLIAQQSTSIKSPESISKNTKYSPEGRKNRETRPGPAVPWVSDKQLRSETGVMAYVDEIRALDGVCDELGALHGVDVDTPGELEAFILAITLNLVRQKAMAAEHVKRGRKPIGSVAAVLVTLLKTGEDGDGNSCRYHADPCLEEAKKFWRQKFGAKRGSDLGKLPTDEEGTQEFERLRTQKIEELNAKMAGAK